MNSTRFRGSATRRSGSGPGSGAARGGGAGAGRPARRSGAAPGYMVESGKYYRIIDPEWYYPLKMTLKSLPGYNMVKLTVGP